MKAQEAAAKSQAAAYLSSSQASQKRRGAGEAAWEGEREGGNTDVNDAAVSTEVDPEDGRGSVAASAAVAAAAKAGEERWLGDGDGAGAGDRGGQVEVGEAGGEALSSKPSEPGLEMLPMGAVGHLSRRDRLGIIKKTVPKEKRMVVLQRLFHLAQGGCWCWFLLRDAD